jgi:hypothetical protein
MRSAVEKDGGRKKVDSSPDFIRAKLKRTGHQYALKGRAWKERGML